MLIELSGACRAYTSLTIAVIAPFSRLLGAEITAYKAVRIFYVGSNVSS